MIDVLNVEKSLQHHWRAYGFWAPSIKNYVEENIMDWFNTPQIKALMRIEDPYSYLDRLTMPKMIISAGGDQFFLPDSWQFYYNDLKGEKNLRYGLHFMYSQNSRYLRNVFRANGAGVAVMKLTTSLMMRRRTADAVS